MRFLRPSCLRTGAFSIRGFSGYRVPRFSDMPQIDIVILDRKDLPSAGAGELA